MEHSNKISYDKAYCNLGEKREYSLNELNMIFTNGGDLGEIKHYLFCPNCKKAKLSYTPAVTGRRAYLSANCLKEHDNNCFYRYSYLSKKKAVEYIKSMTDNKIEDRLNSVLRKLDDLCVISDGVDNKDNVDISDAIIEIKDESNQSIQRVTRKKKLSYRTKFEEFDTVYLFYGVVRLIEKEISYKNDKLYVLNVISNKNKVICSIKCGQNKYLDKREGNYKVAIWGLLENNNGYVNISPIKKSAIKIIEVDNNLDCQ